MTALDLGEQYDVVTCLFSAIGYVRTVARLNRTVACFARHLAPGGVVVVDPWFEPGQLTHGWVMTLTGEAEGLRVCRMSRTVIDGSVSRLEFEYLIGRPSGLERRSETHELGLFTQSEMEHAFLAAGTRGHAPPRDTPERWALPGSPAPARGGGRGPPDPASQSPPTVHSPLIVQQLVRRVHEENVRGADSITYSFSPQRNGQSSMFSRKSGLNIRTPGTTPPAMKLKSARLLP